MMEQAPVLLVMKAVKWKFTKFLIGRNGKVIGRFVPQTKPVDFYHIANRFTIISFVDDF
ncbi:Protein of unknown function [Bacillus mycoides]|nr:Protein of unknown function [Bacillus mycoides]